MPKILVLRVDVEGQRAGWNSNRNSLKMSTIAPEQATIGRLRNRQRSAGSETGNSQLRNRQQLSRQSAGSETGIAEAKSYVLKSTLPEALWTKFVASKGNSQLLGLTFVVTSIVQFAGGKIAEGLEEHDEKHPVFGNVKQAIETITKQRYIQKDRISGPGGDLTVYELAERALDEVVSGKLKQSITQDSINHML